METGAVHDRGTRFLRKLATFGAGCAIFVAIMEVGLRVLGIQPGSGPFDPNVPDPVLGMRPIRNFYQKADFPEHEGDLYLQTNNLGFYQANDTAPKPVAGVTRIVVLGDSFVAGASNAVQNIPAVLEQRLNAARPGQPVEVLNAGVGRYSPYQSYVLLEEEILRLQPKHVVVAVYVGNDFLDMIRQDDRPYLTLEPDGAFRRHPPRFVTYENPSQPPGLLDHSRLYAVVKGLLGPTIEYQLSRVKIMHENLSEFGYSTREILEYILAVAKLDKQAHGMMLQILSQQVWFDRFPRTLDPALKINRHVIELFRDLTKRHGMGLTYTVIPAKEQIEPEDMAEVFEKIQTVDPQWTPERMAELDDRLIEETKQACAALGVEFVELRDGLRARKDARRFYYPYDMHMGPEGNRAVGEILADALAGKALAGKE